MKEFSLVMSGGATRGFYHLGVLQALRELGLKPSEIVGCSAGALIGAIASSRWDRDYLKLAKDLKLERLVLPNPFTTGFLDTRRIEQTLKDLIPARRFDDLTIPLKVNATDANTGEEIVFSGGELMSPLLASMAVPAIFPVREYAGRVLMDGGVSDNLPVRHARYARMVVSDVTFPLANITVKSSKATVLRNAAMIGVLYGRARSLEDVKRKRMVMLRLEDPLFGGELRRAKLIAVAKRGYDDTMRAAPALREMLGLR